MIEKQIQVSIQNLVKDHRPVYVGYSGGPDSGLLLYYAHKLYPGYVVALHYNRSFKKRDDEIEKFCFEVTKKMTIPLITKQHFASKQSKLAWRIGRYSFFSEQADQKIVLVGHHRDDVIENMLLRSCTRGSGYWHIRRHHMLYGCQVARPLLSFSKQDLMHIVQGYKIPYMEDKNICYNQREYVRDKILPMIEDLHPHAKNNLYRTISIVHKQQNILDALIRKFWDIDLKESRLPIQDLRSLGKDHASFLVHHLLHKKMRCSYHLIEHIVDLCFRKEKWTYRISNHYVCQVENDYLRLKKSCPQAGT